MIITLIIFGVIAAYILIGCTAARIARPKIIEINTFHEGDTYIDRWGDQETRRKGGVQRANVHTAIWGMVLFWPIRSWVFAINYALNQELDRADPHLQQRRIEEQDRRIAELERELRIQ